VWVVLKAIIPIPVRAKSGTPSYPDPSDVFMFMTNELLSLKQRDEIIFKNKGTDSWVLLGWHSSEILEVTFKYPYKMQPKEAFSQKGVPIPETWILEKLKKRKKVTFRVDKKEVDSIPPFLDAVFRKFYGCTEGYIVFGRSILKSGDHM
jgi:hypothetical protein